MMPDEGPSVLVVDDDPVFRMYAELSLERAGFRVLSRADGLAAREAIAAQGAEAFSCVLTDYRMPGLDGLGLISWVKERDPSLASILVTVEGEKGLVEQSMRIGAFAFIDKPVEIARLRRLVADAATATARKRSAARMRRDVEEAGQIQKWMIRSAQLSEGIHIELCFHPKHQAGGDFLMHHRLSESRDVILVTDVSGHNMAAAYLSAGFCGFAQGLLAEGIPLEGVLDRYNRFLLRNRISEERVYSVGLTALLVDRSLGVMTTYSCGAPAPAWMGEGGWVCRMQCSRSSPLGWFDGLEPARYNAAIPSEAVWLWTDGLEDLASAMGVSPFSVTHALLAARAAGTEPEWLARAGDDVLVSRIWPGGEPEDPAAGVEPLVAECYGPEQAADINLLQESWQRSLELALPQLCERVRHDLLLCARESILNALKHGCGPQQRAAFQINHVPGERALRLRIADPGPGHKFDVGRRALADCFQLEDLHRGLMLIHGLASKAGVERNGADLTLDFALNGGDYA